MTGWTEASGVAIRYALSGPSDAPGVVLLHELGGSLDSWQDVIPSLDGSLRALAYDQRGCGQSEKVREPFTFADHIRDLIALVAASGLQPPVHVAGVASGAALAVTLAAQRPDLVGAAVLCAPALSVDASRREYLRERSATAAREGMRAIAEATLARSYPPEMRRDPGRYATYRARFLGNDPVCYGWANMAFADCDAQSLLDRVRCRCLVLAGEHDSLRPPAHVRGIADRLPGAVYEVVESGHVMSVQVPSVLAARMLEFLCM